MSTGRKNSLVNVKDTHAHNSSQSASCQQMLTRTEACGMIRAVEVVAFFMLCQNNCGGDDTWQRTININKCYKFQNATRDTRGGDV